MTRCPAPRSLLLVLFAICPLLEAQGPDGVGTRGAAGTAPSAVRPADRAAVDAQAPATKPGAGVCVIDPVKIFEAYPRAIQGKKALEDLDKQISGRLGELTKKLEDLRLQRDQFKMGSRDRALVEIQMNLGAKNYELQKQLMEGDFQVESEKFLAQIYEDIEKATAAVAKERGAQMVVRVHPDAGDGSPGSKARLYERRIVWYASPQVDLTADVIKYLQAMPPEPKGSDAAKDTKEAPKDSARPAGEAKEGSVRK